MTHLRDRSAAERRQSGALLAWSSIRAVIVWPPTALPRGDQAVVDRVLGFTILRSLIDCGHALGVWALRAARVEPCAEPE
jgi:hypothetical protein